jgi:hypothetical protein
MVSRSNIPRPPRQQQAPVNPQLYALCRAGTDPAITRALEEARDPWAKIQRMARENIDWTVVDDITSKLTEARAEAE